MSALAPPVLAVRPSRAGGFSQALARFGASLATARRAAVLAEHCVQEPEPRRTAMLAEIRELVCRGE